MRLGRFSGLSISGKGQSTLVEEFQEIDHYQVTRIESVEVGFF